MGKRERRNKMKAHRENVQKQEYDEKSCKCPGEPEYTFLQGNKICRKCHKIVREPPQNQQTFIPHGDGWFSF